MMNLFLLACILGMSSAANIVEPSDCTGYPCLIFEDQFDFLDTDVWEHEITMAGGGNYEFEVYVNNRSISYTKNSILYIKPDLTENWKGAGSLTSGEMNLWGMNDRGDVCTGEQNNGCQRFGSDPDIINPIMSARMRTAQDFAFKYGRVEVRAQMPRGDWLWPAVWMLSKNWPYGAWPASGEIDIIECRGNDVFGDISNDKAGCTLHWGPYWPLNGFEKTTNFYPNANGERFTENFHTWRMDWTKDSMTFYLDDVEVLMVDPITNFFDFGGFASEGDIDNVWENKEKMAPFDKKFFFIINLAVGGTGGFFPDGIDPNKPWSDSSSTAFKDFYDAKDEWFPTWGDGNKVLESAALKVDYVKVWKLEADA